MPSPRRSLFNSCAEIISLLWTASSCNAKFPMNANGIMWHGNAQPCGFGMLYNSCEILVLCRVPMWNCHTSSAMVFDDPIPNWHRIGTKLASRSHQINLTSKGWNCATQDITSTSTVHEWTLASRRTSSGTGMVAASNATTDWVGTVSSCQFLASGDAQLLLAVASTPVILWWNCPLSLTLSAWRWYACSEVGCSLSRRRSPRIISCGCWTAKWTSEI